MKNEFDLGAGYVSTTYFSGNDEVFGFGYKCVLIDYILVNKIIKFYPNDYLLSGSIEIKPGCIIECEYSDTLKINGNQHFIGINLLYFKYKNKELILNEEKNIIIYNNVMYKLGYTITNNTLLLNNGLSIKISN